MTLGYYVHHEGRGHVARACAIADALAPDVEVTGLSSLERPSAWRGPWVTLPRDDDPPAGEASDPTAHGALHWAPRHHAGLRERMAFLAAWVSAHAPAAVAVDVSVEVTALLRLMGVPVAVIGQPGDRTDAPHTLAYDLADLVLGPWPAWATPHVAPAWAARVTAVGAISRFDGRTADDDAPAAPGDLRVLVLDGRGGAGMPAAVVDAAVAATPEWTWTRLGRDRWVDDPWGDLQSAAVVLTHAGQGAVAEVAAARRPAIVVPQARPFGEQHATARALAARRLATVLEGWPSREQWPGLLEDTARRPVAWDDWSDGRGARRAAHHLRELIA